MKVNRGRPELSGVVAGAGQADRHNPSRGGGREEGEKQRRERDGGLRVWALFFFRRLDRCCKSVTNVERA
jgi:hypothetical protein